MNAFIQTENGTFKVYRHATDWQVIGPCFEQWFSVWNGNEPASLYRAIDAIPSQIKTIEIITLKD